MVHNTSPTLLTVNWHSTCRNLLKIRPALYAMKVGYNFNFSFPKNAIDKGKSHMLAYHVDNRKIM